MVYNAFTMSKVNILKSNLLSKIAGIEHAFLPSEAILPENIIRPRLVHGNQLIIVAEEQDFSTQKADGVITETFLPIGINTADCLPVLMADNLGSRVAAVHAGWRGLNLGILIEAINTLKDLGSAPENLSIAIGPAIGSCCYEVGQEVIDELQSNFGHLWQNIAPPWTNIQPDSPNPMRTVATKQNSGIWLNLRAVANLQLKFLGIPENQIEQVGECTYCGSEKYSSYRRNTHENKKRPAQYCWIKKVQ